MQEVQKGNFTMRMLKEQLQNIQKMGPVSGIMGMIPGFNQMPPVSCCAFCYGCAAAQKKYAGELLVTCLRLPPVCAFWCRAATASRATCASSAS